MGVSEAEQGKAVIPSGAVDAVSGAAPRLARNLAARGGGRKTFPPLLRGEVDALAAAGEGEPAGRGVARRTFIPSGAVDAVDGVASRFSAQNHLGGLV